MLPDGRGVAGEARARAVAGRRSFGPDREGSLPEKYPNSLKMHDTVLSGRIAATPRGATWIFRGQPERTKIDGRIAQVASTRGRKVYHKDRIVYPGYIFIKARLDQESWGVLTRVPNCAVTNRSAGRPRISPKFR